MPLRILCFLLSLSLSRRVFSAPEALMALGNKIVTVAGHCQVKLKGVDVPGMEWSNTGDGPVGAPNKDLATVQEAVSNWSCNFVRLPLAQDRWLGTACGTSATAYRALVQGIVDWSNSHNAYVLLDLHWGDMGVAGSNGACSAGQHDMPDDNSLLFWQSVASTVGIANNPAVFFDLYNEPGGATGNSALSDDPTGWDLWRNGGTVPASADGTAYHTPGMQALLMAIRAAGADNLVMAGGVNWAFNLDGITDYAAALTDTASGQGVVYATHIYPFKWGGNGCVVPACFDSAVPDNVKNSVPVIVTEFGPNVGDPEGFLSPLLTWIDQNGLSFSAWCMHPSASPCLVSDFSYTPTSYFGTPFLTFLQSTNPLGCNPATNTPSPSPSATPTPLPACGDVTLFSVNAAGTAYSDSNGVGWTADSHYGGGSTSSTTVTVSGTLDPTLFKTNRWGNPLSYSFGLPNGTYQVKVLESENYWSAVGARVFSLSLQGSVVQSNLDVYAASGGKFRALTLTYTATVSNGTLSLVGNASVDNAQFAAIQITWLGPACSPTPSITPTLTVSATITPSPTISPTWTESPYLSPTPTFSISPTFTASPDFSATFTTTPTPSITPTFTPAQFSGPLRILNAQAVPNPNPVALSVLLSKPADKVSADFFSVGLSQVLTVHQEDCSAGYNSVPLPAAWDLLPNGLYFVRARASGSGEEAEPKVFKLMKMR